MYKGSLQARTFKTDLGLVTALRLAKGCLIRLESDGTEQYLPDADFNTVCARLMGKGE